MSEARAGPPLSNQSPSEGPRGEKGFPWGCIPAVDHDGPRAGSGLWAVLHLSHQTQQGPRRFWGLVVRPGREEDVLQGPALLLVLGGGGA